MGGGIANFTNVAATFKVILVSVLLLMFVLLNQSLSFFKNTVDTDWLASSEANQSGSSGL